MFWKYAANLQENTHVEVRFQSSCIFSEHLFLGAPLNGCFWREKVIHIVFNNLAYIFVYSKEFINIHYSHFLRAVLDGFFWLCNFFKGTSEPTCLQPLNSPIPIESTHSPIFSITSSKVTSTNENTDISENFKSHNGIPGENATTISSQGSTSVDVTTTHLNTIMNYPVVTAANVVHNVELQNVLNQAQGNYYCKFLLY